MNKCERVLSVAKTKQYFYLYEQEVVISLPYLCTVLSHFFVLFHTQVKGFLLLLQTLNDCKVNC